MISVYDIKTNCCGCEACRQICPKHCITMQSDEKGFIYPKINQDLCIDCKLCQSVCPLHSTIGTNPNDTCFVYINDDAEFRLRSASSGAFEALCKSFADTNQDIVIFGCEIDDSLNVKHSASVNYVGFERLKKSKYVQSKLNDCYSQVRQYLKEGKFVVFSGVPCQIYGLRKFLRKDYENLLLIDLICHGVPSQKVFDSYIKTMQYTYGKKVKEYSFRHKEIYMGRWISLSIKAIFTDGSEVCLNCSEDLYMNGFLQGLFNRDCCYDCKFASTDRCSDLTIGDFWGIADYNPNFDDGKTNGTSLIIASTEKGRRVIHNLTDCTLEEVPISIAVPHNGQLSAPQKLNEKREIFFSKLHGNLGFIRAMSACFPDEYSIKDLFLKRLYRHPLYKKLSSLKQSILK